MHPPEVTVSNGHVVPRQPHRRGKVARLPKVVRDQVNQMLRDGSSYKHILETLQSKPETAAVEKLFFSRNVTTAIAVGQARGVIMLCLQKANIEPFEYTPNEVKQAVAGYGSADKRQVQEMVRALLQLDKIPQPDDAADALAIAITHLNTNRY